MPLSPLGPLPGTNPLLSGVIQQFIDVLTGTMTDQPITIANTLTVTNTLTASSNVTFLSQSSGNVVTVGAAGLLGGVAPGAAGNVLTSSAGLWASVAPSATTPIYKELGVGTATLNQSITATSSPGTDVTGLTATVTPDGIHDVKITISMPNCNTALQAVRFSCALQRDGGIINTFTDVTRGAAALATIPFTHVDSAPTSSAHNYKASIWVASSTTFNTINGDGTSPTNLILVEQIGS